MSKSNSVRVISSSVNSNYGYTLRGNLTNSFGQKNQHRNTRQGFAGLVTLTLILIAILMFSGIQSAEAFKPAEVQVLTVNSGDSIWSIASNLNQTHYDGKQDVRQLVYSICEVNELNSPVIQPGQTLQIPLP